MRALLLREWNEARGNGSAFVVSLGFLFAVVVVASFAIGAELTLLARLGPAILWIATVLASLLGTERLFAADHADGTLDLVRAESDDLFAYVSAKLLARWLFVTLPLAFASPLGALLLAMEPRAILGTFVALAIGSLALASLSAIGAALSSGARATPMLGTLVVFPLLTPLVVFGTATATGWSTQAGTTPLLLLCAATLASVAGAYAVIPALLRSRG